MPKLVEIGGLIKKGLGQTVEKFSDNDDVLSVGFANEDLIYLIFNNSEMQVADILTLIVKERKSNQVFDDSTNSWNYQHRRMV